MAVAIGTHCGALSVFTGARRHGGGSGSSTVSPALPQDGSTPRIASPPKDIPQGRTEPGLPGGAQLWGRTPAGPRAQGWERRGCRLPGQLPHGTPPPGQKELCGADPAGSVSPC